MDQVDQRDLDYSRRSSPPPFLLKTHTLVEDPATDEIISWNQEGTTFVVWQPAEFARDLLPKLFKHSNFSSFVRQLNTYGFRKASSGRWEFQNDNFQRGERDLLCEIRRRKAWSTGKNIYTSSAKTQPFDQLDEDDQDLGSSSSSSTSSDYVNLREENARLKRENGVLYWELVGAKKRCRELLDLVGIYAKSVEAEEDQRPKLFGVRLEVQPEKKKKKRLEMSEALHLMLSQA